MGKLICEQRKGPCTAFEMSFNYPPITSMKLCIAQNSPTSDRHTCIGTLIVCKHYGMCDVPSAIRKTDRIIIRCACAFFLFYPVQKKKKRKEKSYYANSLIKQHAISSDKQEMWDRWKTWEHPIENYKRVNEGRSKKTIIFSEQSTTAESLESR